MIRVGSAASIARTLFRLGPVNVATVAAYRLAKKRGWFPRPRAQFPAVGYFDPGRRARGLPPGADCEALEIRARAIRDGRIACFGGPEVSVGWPFSWHRNVLDGTLADASLPWWRENRPNGGDIKGIWELSRFDWALDLARAHVAWPSEGYIRDLEFLVRDWTRHNAPYLGPNWECGQETSIRLLQLLLAADLVGNGETPTSAFATFAAIHVDRVLQTRLYAMAQDNNHGITEAVALFAAGGWLASHAAPEHAALGRKAGKLGRYWLENRVARLFFADGGFSQYSVNYHRLALDTLTQAEYWRAKLGLAPFSSRFHERAADAVAWMRAFVDPNNGDAPNLGSNDGARLFRLDDLPFRDFRPSLQAASLIFTGRPALHSGPWNAAAEWLRLSPKQQAIDVPSAGRTFSQSGFAMLCAGPRQCVRAYLRVPRQSFRPGQADPLHLDLWLDDGTNLLRDAGTFSYVGDAAKSFKSIRSHNTIEFDNREPMPSIGQFLYSDWIGASQSSIYRRGEKSSMHAEYRDYAGARHRRRLTLSDRRLVVLDEIDGFRERAVLRWHLVPGDWVLEGSQLQLGSVVIRIDAKGSPVSLHLTVSEEAPTYGVRGNRPCLEVAVEPGCFEVETSIEFGR